MKGKSTGRSERLVTMTRLLVDNPSTVFSLAKFMERFHVAKSTISEDLSILRTLFFSEDLGKIETMTGAAGGVKYVPSPGKQSTFKLVQDICNELSDPARILPGGFLYISDLISSPSLMQQVGAIFAGHFAGQMPDTVITLETRGIPIALMTARALNVPLAVARRVNRVTEGTVVTVNYVSGSKRIETMSLSRRALTPGMRVLIVDDFMKAGGTARGLVDLVGEFQADVVGIGVLVSTEEPKEKLVENYVSMAVLERVDEGARTVIIRPSSWSDGTKKAN